MAIFSQSDIDGLISCPKEVSEAPRALKLVGANWRKDAKFTATDGTEGVFAVFMRRSEDLPENFSVGLVYSPRDGRPEITLLRCNGKHGIYNGNNGFDAAHPHYDFHIHRATEVALESGCAAEKYASSTSEFASFEEAEQYFLKAVNLKNNDIVKYFPSNTQTDLVFDSDDHESS